MPIYTRSSPKELGANMKLRSKRNPIFHPNLSHIVGSAPSPLGRAVGYLLCMFIVVAIVWSCYTEVDKIAVVNGQLVTKQRPQIILSPREGIINNVLVAEGEMVVKGQVILTLDNDLEHIQFEKLNQRLAELQIKLWASDQIELVVSKQLKSVAIPDSENKKNDLYMLEVVRATNTLSAYQIETDYLQNVIDMTDAEIERSRQNIINLSEILASSGELEKMTKKLYDRNLVSRVDLLGSIDKRVVSEKELNDEKANLVFLHEKKKAQVNNKIKFKEKFLLSISESRIGQFNELNKVKLEIEAIEKTIELSQITAPFTGHVITGKIPNRGDVVDKYTPLLELAPVESDIEMVALLRNKDRGHVEEGMPVTIKLDGYSYIKYGVLEGSVKLVAKNARNYNDSYFVYPVVIELDSNQMLYDGQQYPLISGMSGVAEIKVGQRKLMSFFMEPMLESFKESFKEY